MQARFQPRPPRAHLRPRPRDPRDRPASKDTRVFVFFPDPGALNSRTHTFPEINVGFTMA